MLTELLDIYLVCFKMGAVTFGGGYAMLPILRREIVQSRQWVDEETIMDYYALSQGLPGIIAVNVSVFIGHKVKGALGATAAALGMISPCILIISLIAACLSSFQDNPYVRHALAGVSACVAALILDAVVALWKKGVKDTIGIVICFGIMALTLMTKVNPIFLIIACAILGVKLAPKKNKKEAKP